MSNLEVNKQRVSSDFVELFRLTKNGTNYYFTSYYQDVTFRDETSPYTQRTYTKLPIEFSGYSQSMEGALDRPTLTVANVLTTFSDALGTNNDALVGARLTRRRTLASQVGIAPASAPGSNAPTEFPLQVYIIDRVQSETALAVVFELANPFDLEGVTVPSRQVIPNNCSWAYQGLTFATPTGACSWNNTTNGVTAYFDIRNNLLLSDFNTFTLWSSGPIALDNLYKTTVSLNRYNIDGTTTPVPSGLFDHWQARSSTTPVALNTSNCRRVKVYSAWNNSTTYYSYKEGDIYNTLVSYNGSIWSCVRSNINVAPAYDSLYWKRADICGKKLSSCASRYRAKPFTTAQPITIASTVENKDAVLPFGGFPASRRLNTY
jgi:lambda family phage minor tail protein L